MKFSLEEAKIESLLSINSETEVIEFKKATNDFDEDKIGRYFSALSNEANLKNIADSYLIFGISDKINNLTSKRDVLGTGYRENGGLEKLKHHIAENTSNHLGFKEVLELSIEDKRVVVFKIPAAPPATPIAWKGNWYARNGESLTTLAIDKLTTIRNQDATRDWSSEVCDGASIDDLDEDAIAKAREEYKKKINSKIDEINNWNNLTFLKKAKIITPNGKITNASLMILGKPESEYFLSPKVVKIRWILKDENNLEKDYESFGMPLILSVDKILGKIRNLRFRHLPDNTLFPLEIDTYDSYVIREALHNCIAHQDYSLQHIINVVEKPDCIIFTNAGSFLPETIENVIERDAPFSFYRNTFLATAMINVNMIDAIGSGIKKMFIKQRERFFPLPEYEFTNQQIKTTIFGKIIDQEYAKLLINNASLNLQEVILLDKVQKGKTIPKEEAIKLKKIGLINGRYPKMYVSNHIASISKNKAQYIKNRGLDDTYYRKMIIDYIKEYKEATRSEISELLKNKLSEVLDEKQKNIKIKNLLASLKRNGILSCGKGASSVWKLNG